MALVFVPTMEAFPLNTGDIKVENIRKLAELVEKHSLAELTLEEDGLSITIKGKNAVETAPASKGAVCDILLQTNEIETTETDDSIELKEADEEDDSPDVSDTGFLKITAPMVGVFYRASTPESPSFVEIGDHVEVGQTIGLIEAMKVFSEIPSEFSGEVIDIPVSNGELVQQGDVLMILKSKETE